MIEDITEAIAFNMQQQSERLMQIVRPMSQSDKKVIAIDSQLELFKSFGIQEPLTEKRIHVEKQPLKGCTAGTYFEFPHITSSAKNELFV